MLWKLLWTISGIYPSCKTIYVLWPLEPLLAFWVATVILWAYSAMWAER